MVPIGEAKLSSKEKTQILSIDLSLDPIFTKLCTYVYMSNKYIYKSSSYMSYVVPKEEAKLSYKERKLWSSLKK